MPRSIELNNAKTVFVREAYDNLSCDRMSFGELVSLVGSLAGRASQFESLSVQKQHDLVLSAVKKALDLLSSEKPELSQKIQEAEEHLKNTLPIFLNGFEHAYRERKANSFWGRLNCELKEAWCELTRGVCTEMAEVAKEDQQTPVLPEKTDVVVQQVQKSLLVDSLTLTFDLNVSLLDIL